MSRTKRIHILIIGLVLAACAPLAARTPEPTPQWITIYASSAWQPLAEKLAGCVPNGSAIAYVDSPKQAAAVLAWSNDPAVLFASNPDLTSRKIFTLGAEELVPIIHPRNPVQSISALGLSMVYTGEIRNWDLLGQSPAPLTAWAYPPSDEISQTAGYAGLTFSGGARVASSPAELRAAVAADPTAIGLLPRRWLDGTVRELPVDGLDPALLRAPLVALTQGEPQGPLREWLFCLQQRQS